MHRFVWDLRGPPPAATQHGYPIAAVYRDTPREPRGPIVIPGRYTVRLTVDSRIHAETLSVRMDPRVTTPAADFGPDVHPSLPPAPPRCDGSPLRAPGAAARPGC